MSVVPLEKARRNPRTALQRGGGWQPDEMAGLMQFYAIWKGQDGAAGYAFGETDQHEPQFYVPGGDPARPCLACISRLWRAGYAWYVVEDGSGGIRSEGHDLGALVARERSSTRPFVSAPLLLALPALFRLLTDLDWIRAEAGVALASQPGIISPESILSWTSQVFAIA